MHEPIPLPASSENGGATCHTHTSHIIQHTWDDADRLFLPSLVGIYLPRMAEQMAYVEIRCAMRHSSESIIFSSALSVIALVCCRITRAITFIFIWEVTRNMRELSTRHTTYFHIINASPFGMYLLPLKRRPLKILKRYAPNGVWGHELFLTKSMTSFLLWLSYQEYALLLVGHVLSCLVLLLFVLSKSVNPYSNLYLVLTWPLRSMLCLSLSWQLPEPALP